MLRVLLQQIEQYIDLFVLQEALGRKGVQTPDETELNALKERVKMLSYEKIALEGKLKKLSQSKKGQYLALDMHSTSRSAQCLQDFLSIEYTACAKSLEIQKSLVLDLKILMC